MTHGGDGLFLWAGQHTMDSGEGGANVELEKLLLKAPPSVRRELAENERALPLGKNRQTYPRVHRRAAQAPHAFQVRSTIVVRHRNIAKTLHHPAVDGDAKVRFKFQSAEKLRNRGVQHKGIE